MRQLGGAVLGVMAAGVIYVIVNQYSTSQLSGLLVDTNTVTENADRIRVNNKNIDDETLRRITTRAQTVANALEDSKQAVATSSVPALVANATDRAAARAAALAALADRQNAPTYTVDPRTGNTAVADRLAIRTERIQQMEAVSSVSSSLAVISQEIVPTEQLHSGAPLMREKAPTKLPSSGLGTVIITITTLMLTVGIAMRRTVAL